VVRSLFGSSLRLHDVRSSRFDIYSFGLQAEEDKEGMLKSKRQITQLVQNEINAGITLDRIFLGGFSQGGTMSLLVGLTGEYKFAALAILSSWLPLRKEFKSVCDSARFCSSC
jgi:lysophospholipase-1